MRKFPKVLRELRNDRGLTQQELGDMTEGVSPSYVALLETGQRLPSLDAVAALAASLRCRARERERLFEARDHDRGRRSGGTGTSPRPLEPLRGADELSASADDLVALIERVKAITAGLASRWGSAGEVLSERVVQWEQLATEAATKLRKISGAVEEHAERYKDIDEALASELRNL